MAHKLPNGKFRVTLRHSGLPTIDKTFDTLAEAEAFQAAKEAEIAASKSIWGPEMTLAEAARQYKGSLLFSSKTLRTQRTELGRLKPVLEALGGFSLANLENGQRIVAYRDERARRVSKKTGRKVSLDDVRLELAALSAVFAWVVENRILARNPLVGIKRPQGKPRRRRVYEDEELNLLSAMVAEHLSDDQREAARFLIIQRELGCRPSELTGLKREDVDLDHAAVIFRDTKDQARDRTVHLTEHVRDALASQLVHGAATNWDSPFVFTSRSLVGRHPVPAYYRRYVQIVKALKLVDTDYHAHANRREFTSAAFENGMTHADVMKVTGHRTYAAVQMYNVSQGLAPRVRERIDAEAKLRASDRTRALAAELGVSVADLMALIEARKPKLPSAPASSAGSKIVSMDHRRLKK